MSPNFRKQSLIVSIASIFVWSLLTFTISNSEIGQESNNRIASTLEFNFRKYVGHSPKLDPSIKILSFNEATLNTVKRPIFYVDEWAAILSRIAAYEPKAIIINKMFSMLYDPNKKFEKAKDIIKNIKSPIAIASFATKNKISSKMSLNYNQKKFDLNFLGDIGLRPANFSDSYNKPYDKAVAEQALTDEKAQIERHLYGPSTPAMELFPHIGHVQYNGFLRIPPAIKLSKNHAIPHIGFYASDLFKLKPRSININNYSLNFSPYDDITVNLTSLRSFSNPQISLKEIFKKKSVQGLNINKGDIVILLMNMYTGATDFHMTPFGYLPGGYFLTSMVNSIVTGKWLNSASNPLLLIVASSILGTFIAIASSSSFFWLITVVSILTLLVTGLGTFAYFDLIIPWLWMITAMLGSALIVFAEKVRYNEKRSQKLKQVESEKVFLSKIVEKNRVIQSILTNIRQGIFTIDEQLTINDQYSPYLEAIFEESTLSNLPIKEIFLNRSNLSRDQYDQLEGCFICIGSDQLNFDLNAHLLPNEIDYSYNNTVKQLELSWDTILNDQDEIEKIIVSVRDISELNKLKEEIEKNQQEMVVISQILKSGVDEFTDFYQSSMSYIDESRQSNEASGVQLIFRALHTIKGGARTYHYSGIVDVVHESEQYYQDCRNNKVQFSNEHSTERLNKTADIIENYKKTLEKYIPREDSQDSAYEKLIHIIKANIDQQHKKIDAPRYLKILEDSIKQFESKQQTLDQILEPLILSVEDICKELTKPTANVSVSANDIQISHDKKQVLVDSMTHIIRNSLDHGIESSDIRLDKGKPSMGTIKIQAFEHNQTIRIVVEDDGQGLNLALLKKKGVESQQINAEANDSDVANLIFGAGVSTAQTVTNLSGRGIGMDAVKSFLKGEGGLIEIEFTGPRSDSGYRPFKYIITL